MSDEPKPGAMTSEAIADEIHQRLDGIERRARDGELKLDSARQIFEGLQGHAVPLQWSRRIDHWLASATPSKEERLVQHLMSNLAKAAVAWSAEDGQHLLHELKRAAHELRAAGML